MNILLRFDWSQIVRWRNSRLLPGIMTRILRRSLVHALLGMARYPGSNRSCRRYIWNGIRVLLKGRLNVILMARHRHTWWPLVRFLRKHVLSLLKALLVLTENQTITTDISIINYHNNLVKLELVNQLPTLKLVLTRVWRCGWRNADSVTRIVQWCSFN